MLFVLLFIKLSPNDGNCTKFNGDQSVQHTMMSSLVGLLWRKFNHSQVHLCQLDSHHLMFHLWPQQRGDVTMTSVHVYAHAGICCRELEFLHRVMHKITHLSSIHHVSWWHHNDCDVVPSFSYNSEKQHSLLTPSTAAEITVLHLAAHWSLPIANADYCEILPTVCMARVVWSIGSFGGWLSRYGNDVIHR